MKKYLLVGFLLLTSACQNATQPPAPFLSPTSTFLPAPIPDAQTPEPTLTPEPTPTPLPRFFTNEFDSSLAGWVTLQAGNQSVPNVEIKNSALRLQMDSAYTFLYALYGAEDYGNVHVETEFVNSALSPASIGLVCDYSEELGWFEYNISTDHTYQVLYGKWLDNGIADYLPIAEGEAKEIVQSGDVQRIGLTCSGTTLQLYINGTFIRKMDVTKYGLIEGKVGLTASSFENVPVIAVFDWLKVSEP